MALVVVNVADMQITANPEDTLVTYALGSCLGITLYDPVAGVAGLLHVMMPTAKIAPEKAERNPLMFVDTGVPFFFKAAYEAGAVKERLIIKVAGGSCSAPSSDLMDMGDRNLIMLRKLFWKNRVMIAREDVGGYISRSVYVEAATGRVWLKSQGEQWDL